jgi:hypothetical protein
VLALFFGVLAAVLYPVARATGSPELIAVTAILGICAVIALLSDAVAGFKALRNYLREKRNRRGAIPNRDDQAT